MNIAASSLSSSSLKSSPAASSLLGILPVEKVWPYFASVNVLDHNFEHLPSYIADLNLLPLSLFLLQQLVKLLVESSQNHPVTRHLHLVAGYKCDITILGLPPSSNDTSLESTEAAHLLRGNCNVLHCCQVPSPNSPHLKVHSPFLSCISCRSES